jgi:hypothetical protein
MLRSLIAYDADGGVIATLDHLVARDVEARAVGLVDFGAHEDAGRELTDIWTVEGAKGSKTWPEWLGARAHEFRVELAGPPGQKRITSLVHKKSGYRRDRAALDRAIGGRIKGTPEGQAPDLRDLIGGPGRALPLGEDGSSVSTDRPALPYLTMMPSR